MSPILPSTSPNVRPAELDPWHSPWLREGVGGVIHWFQTPPPSPTGGEEGGGVLGGEIFARGFFDTDLEKGSQNILHVSPDAQSRTRDRPAPGPKPPQKAGQDLARLPNTKFHTRNKHTGSTPYEICLLPSASRGPDSCTRTREKSQSEKMWIWVEFSAHREGRGVHPYTKSA